MTDAEQENGSSKKTARVVMTVAKGACTALEVAGKASGLGPIEAFGALSRKILDTIDVSR